MSNAGRAQNNAAKQAKQQSSKRSARFGVIVSIFGIAGVLIAAATFAVMVWPHPNALVRTDVQIYYASQVPPPSPTPTPLSKLDQAYIGLTCAGTSALSDRSDAHMCTMGYGKFAPLMDPCFEGPPGYMDCPGSPGGKPQLLPVFKVRKFAMDSSNDHSLSVDQADTQKYPWALDVDHDGTQLTCLLNWGIGSDPHFVGGKYTCGEDAVRINLVLNPEALQDGSDPTTIEFFHTGAAGTKAVTFDGVELDRSGKLWTIKLTDKDTATLRTYDVSTAWV